MAAITDDNVRTREIGTAFNGVDLLIGGTGSELVIDLLSTGIADVRDEGLAIRLDRGLAAKLATELFGLLTG